MINTFQFNQTSKEKSCGWRCLYSLIPEKMEYSEFLERFKYFNPIKNGIYFSNITSVLKYYGLDYVYTIPAEKGTFLIWSSVGKDGKEWAFEGGHYFIYEDKMIYDTLKSEPYKASLFDLIKLIETKDAKKSFTCLKIT